MFWCSWKIKNYQAKPKVYDLWSWGYHQVILQFSNFSSEQFDWLCFMVWASFITKKCRIMPPFHFTLTSFPLLHLKSRGKEQLMMKRLFSSSVPSLSPAASQYCSYTVRKISWSYAMLRLILTVVPCAACRDAIIQQGWIWFWSGTFTQKESKTKGKRSLVTNFLKTSSLCK